MGNFLGLCQDLVRKLSGCYLQLVGFIVCGNKLFNLSILTDKQPLQWKQAKVVPIPKTTDATSPSCYCPISLIPVISKVLERHIRNLIMDHLHLHHFISDHQWGFLEGRSTVTAFVKCTGSETLKMVPLLFLQ